MIEGQVDFDRRSFVILTKSHLILLLCTVSSFSFLTFVLLDYCKNNSKKQKEKKSLDIQGGLNKLDFDHDAKKRTQALKVRGSGNEIKIKKPHPPSDGYNNSQYSARDGYAGYVNPEPSAPPYEESAQLYMQPRCCNNINDAEQREKQVYKIINNKNTQVFQINPLDDIKLEICGLSNEINIKLVDDFSQLRSVSRLDIVIRGNNNTIELDPKIYFLINDISITGDHNILQNTYSAHH